MWDASAGDALALGEDLIVVGQREIKVFFFHSYLDLMVPFIRPLKPGKIINYSQQFFIFAGVSLLNPRISFLRKPRTNIVSSLRAFDLCSLT